jgi:signal transduction histidine kinase
MDSGELGDLTSKQRGPMSIITQRVRALSRMLNDLIAISSADAQMLREEIVDLTSLLRAALVNFRTRAEKVGLSLKVEIDPGLPPVSGDPDQLSRVVDNLLNNALKFTPAGGSLTVRLWCDGDGKVIVPEVVDTGIGIPTEKLNRIFDRFYQIDGSARRRYGGVGLGLALVKKIIEAHKGQVSVWSTLGKGSTFRVTLPTLTVSEQGPDKGALAKSPLILDPRS